MKNNILSGLCAGIVVSIGGTVFLACDNKYIGAILFSVALLCICFKGYALFTGRIGSLAEQHTFNFAGALLLWLLGNAAGTVVCGLLIRFALPKLGENAAVLCTGKLDQQLWSTLIRGVFCGILMYLAVSIYREKASTLGILFCIPVFILSGFEHSIADIFYFSASGIFSGKVLLFILVVIVGNSIGSLLLPILNDALAKGRKPQ